MYPEAVEAADFFREIEQRYWLIEQADTALRLRVIAAARNAVELPGYFLEHIHGTARVGSTPDSLTLGQQLRANRAVVAEISRSN